MFPVFYLSEHWKKNITALKSCPMADLKSSQSSQTKESIETVDFSHQRAIKSWEASESYYIITQVK